MPKKDKRWFYIIYSVILLIAAILPFALGRSPFIESAKVLLYLIGALAAILLILSYVLDSDRSKHFLSFYEIDRANRDKYNWTLIVKRTRHLFIGMILLSLIGLVILYFSIIDNENLVVMLTLFSAIPLVFYANPRRKDTFKK